MGAGNPSAPWQDRSVALANNVRGTPGSVLRAKEAFRSAERPSTDPSAQS
jgi:hypothetical protein